MLSFFREGEAPNKLLWSLLLSSAMQQPPCQTVVAWRNLWAGGRGSPCPAGEFSLAPGLGGQAGTRPALPIVNPRHFVRPQEPEPVPSTPCHATTFYTQTYYLVADMQLQTLLPIANLPRFPDRLVCASWVNRRNRRERRLDGGWIDWRQP